MQKRRINPVAFIMVLLFTALTIALAAVAAQHIGHKCDTSFECHICKLLEQRELFSLATLFTAIHLIVYFNNCLNASDGACFSLPFSSLVRLHVQMND